VSPLFDKSRSGCDVALEGATYWIHGNRGFFDRLSHASRGQRFPGPFPLSLYELPSSLKLRRARLRDTVRQDVATSVFCAAFRVLLKKTRISLKQHLTFN